ncbi:iron complex transport system ATP-binding protein [Glaciihabitans tibetensis]|uniref:Iron complex transport system ATP-binding protein n=1 Tax=Glaciihabitans tibetensis TaxID=1266600 RepID=A0A2T0VBS1_9MICO|nr:heme ABC transporter ATP-binding protein [Glaciihabitans tibetensis]PRY67620.1 iron complex transport system ATP-binding protein [Glaciihabitans tibetensis]
MIDATQQPTVTSTTTIALEGRDLSFTVRGQALLSQVTLAVAAGQVTAIIGPNGAGKSTLLGVLAGDIRPTTGSVLVHQRPLGEYSVTELARNRSVMLQQSAVAFSYTVREVVEMGVSAWDKNDGRDATAVVTRALDNTDSTRFAHRDVTTLSGGEQARAALARVLAQDAPVVLLDEPTASLDISHQELVLGLAGSLAAAGGAVVIVLHDLDAAATHADHIVMLVDGRVAAAGPPAEVMTSAILTEVYGHPIDVIEHPATGRRLVVPARTRQR